MSFLNSKRWIITLALMVLAFFIVPELMAQDEVAGDPAVEEGPKKVTLLGKIIEAGAFMIPIVILLILTIMLAVFNALQLGKKKFAPEELKDEILANMAEVRVRSAIDVAAPDPSYLGRLVASSYTHVDATTPEDLGREKVDDAIADFSIRENSRYMTWIGYFSVIAQAAPMIGLFGTVAGMILAFETMNQKGADPAALAGNISIALMTTAGGLVVAIPAIFCFYIFKNLFNKLVSEAQNTAIEGVDLAIATVNADQQLAKVPEGISAG